MRLRYCAAYLLIATSSAVATDTQRKPTYYGPHFELGGYYFTDAPHTAAVLRAFLPVINDNPNDLTYVDARGIVKKGGTIREGNLGLGYRHLNPQTQKMYGGYLFYDRKQSGVGFLFSQFTLGENIGSKRLSLAVIFICQSALEVLHKTLIPPLPHLIKLVLLRLIFWLPILLPDQPNML